LDEQVWIGLAVKLLATAAIVLIAAKVVERSSAFLGAMVATLPISAGPAYVLLAMEHDDAFIAASSLVSLMINTGASAFMTSYAFMAQRFGAILSTAVAMLCWLAVAVMMVNVTLGLPTTMAVNFSCAILGMLATRHLVVPGRAKVAAQPQWWDIPFRALVVITLVAGVLVAARIAGPKAAGIGALVPVVLASITLILHPRIGGPATAEVMINCFTGMIGIASGLAVVHLTAIPFGAPIALALGLSTCIVWNSLLILFRQMRAGRLTRSRPAGA
jgi:hypothetical protein